MRPCRRQAFTVIEMMVVMTIIAILGAILFPVFARAREKGYQSTCAFNLRNIGLSMSVYAAEHYGHFPPKDNDLWPLVPKYLPEAGVFVCPTVTSLQGRLQGWQAPGRVSDVPAFPCDYVYRAGFEDDRDPSSVYAADDTADRHNDGGIYLFVDGHTKWMKPDLQGRDMPPGFNELRSLMVQGQWREHEHAVSRGDEQ